jgi:hypothetical protein
VVYDVSDPVSLQNVEYWIKNIKTHASENVRVVLVGNKTDLRAAALAAAAAASGGTSSSPSSSSSASAGGQSSRGAGTAVGGTDGDHRSPSAPASGAGIPAYKTHNDSGSSEGDLGDDKSAGSAVAACSDYGAGREVADRFQIPYFETSALNALGTANAFMNVARFCVGVEDGNPDLLKPVSLSATEGDKAGGSGAGSGTDTSPPASKPSMISRMMGRAPLPPPKAAPAPASTSSAPPASGAKDKDKKKCTMQ